MNAYSMSTNEWAADMRIAAHDFVAALNADPGQLSTEPRRMVSWLEDQLSGDDLSDYTPQEKLSLESRVMSFLGEVLIALHGTRWLVREEFRNPGSRFVLEGNLNGRVIELLPIVHAGMSSPNPSVIRILSMAERQGAFPISFDEGLIILDIMSANAKDLMHETLDLCLNQDLGGASDFSPFALISHADGRKSLKRFIPGIGSLMPREARGVLAEVSDSIAIAMAWRGSLASDGAQTDVIFVQVYDGELPKSALFAQKVAHENHRLVAVDNPVLIEEGPSLREQQ